jgi:isoleucyl-tRNA synthetase
MFSGYQVNYVPGWDCHGLPIELNAIKSLKKISKSSNASNISFNKNDPNDVRKIANNYALNMINVQMNSFKKMNLLADWSNVYKTLNPDFLCGELDLFLNLYEKKLIYRNYMPVFWSTAAQTGNFLRLCKIN